MCVSVGINMKRFEFTSWTTSVNSVFTILSSCAVMLGPLITIVKLRSLWRVNQKLEIEDQINEMSFEGGEDDVRVRLTKMWDKQALRRYKA